MGCAGFGLKQLSFVAGAQSGSGFRGGGAAQGKVQLLAGFSDAEVHPAAQARGIACLERFAQRVVGVPRRQIVSMGTHVLRQWQQRQGFVQSHRSIMGVDLQVISGTREAQLVYAAVNHHMGVSTAPRLVLDIGGGSTEFAFGVSGRAQRMVSAEVGCVGLRDAYLQAATLEQSPMFPAAYEAARAAAVATITRATRELPALGGCEIVGTSGTIESVQTVLRASGLGADRINAAGIAQLEQDLLDGRWLINFGLPGLAPDRVDIFPTGSPF